VRPATCYSSLVGSVCTSCNGVVTRWIRSSTLTPVDSASPLLSRPRRMTPSPTALSETRTDSLRALWRSTPGHEPVRWSTPVGALNSCCGVAVLSAQSLVVSSSLRALHVRAPLARFDVLFCGALHPYPPPPTSRCIALAPARPSTAWKASTSPRSSPRMRPAARCLRPCARADARTGLPRSTVRALRWDDQRCRLDDLGDVAAAGAGFAGAHRPLAVVPAPSTSGGPDPTSS